MGIMSRFKGSWQYQGYHSVTLLSINSHDMAVIKILFDEEYWNGLFCKLNDFYVKSIPFIRSLST